MTEEVDPIIGQVFGYVRVISRAGRDHKSNALYNYQCLQCLFEGTRPGYDLARSSKCGNKNCATHRSKKKGLQLITRQKNIDNGLTCNHFRSNGSTYSMCNSCGCRWRAYGIKPKEFLEMIESQAGLCACCCKIMNPNDTNIDHDWRVPKGYNVRGLLCTSCNARSVERTENDVLSVYGAIDYLNQWKNRNE